ncbi:TPA: hypothetical protein ACXHW4_001602 [Enterobacter hormaechei]
MDESRKAFEQWLMEEFGYRHDYLEYWRGEGDYKSHPDLRSRWQGWNKAWQASRAAIEIELPEWFSPNDCGDRAMWSDAVEKAIRAAGIKVKE